MPPELSPATSLAGLLALALVVLPLGLLLVRLGEKLVGRRVLLSPIERALTALFASGAFLYIGASLPFAIYRGWVVETTLGLAAAVLGYLWAVERGRSLGPLVRLTKDWKFGAIGVGTLGLLTFLLVTAGTPALPNSFDGSVQALFVTLLLSHHSVAYTLLPYANAGITYPQATAVWLSLPPLLWGWPIALTPAVLPLFFLALGVPAAYCWGERLGGFGTPRGKTLGLVVGAFFGLVASWPRLFVGGSYDFAIALPLFFLACGWLVPLTAQRPWDLRMTLGAGLLVGTMAALSVAVGETFVLLLLVGLFVFPQPGWRPFREIAPRLVGIVLCASAFLLQSIVATVYWWSYPGHVLSAAGSPPYQPPAPLVPASLTLASAIQMLDPFVPWKEKLSPFPWVSLEIALLLATGLAILILWAIAPSWRARLGLPSAFVRHLAVFAAVTFGGTAALVLFESANPILLDLEAFASISEESLLLFIAFQLIAAVPLLATVHAWSASRIPPAREPPGGAEPSDAPPPRHRVERTRPASGRRSGILASLFVLVVVIPLASGAVATVLQGPAYLDRQATQMGNVSLGDFQALEWAGANLPGCSRVLVAPGSAAQFLPEYAQVSVLYPMVPTPVNLSYNLSVASLTSGHYDNSTRAALTLLGVTEVFVTGRTSVSYAPFQPVALLGSSDFTLLFVSGDAYVFEFVPGASQSGCTP